jgi:hypothetical protein
MSLFRRGDVWWYEFWFAGRRIQESSKSPSKTIARTAEQKRKREVRLPPAEPGASLCEPLKAALAGSLTRPRLSWATFSVAGHFHMLS